MKKHQIVVLDGYTENPGDLSWAGLEELGNLTVYDRTPESKIKERIGDAEIIITNKTPITAETIKNCPSIKYIGVLATGYNVVDVNAAKGRGIPVCNIPTYGTEAVAQFSIALLLEVCHHIGAHSNAVHAGRWQNNEDFCFWDYPLIELAFKTIGIIGFGRIGQAVGRIAKAMGMNVIAHDEYQNDSGREIAKYVSLEELLTKSDVISLNCPLLPSTEGIINKSNIAKMKSSAILINTARGQLINEQDLADALNNGKIFAAAIDVVSKEPIDANNPLLKAKNCIITPHIAWAPKESRNRLMGIAVDNVRAFINGKPENTVE